MTKQTKKYLSIILLLVFTISMSTFMLPNTVASSDITLYANYSTGGSDAILQNVDPSANGQKSALATKIQIQSTGYINEIWLSLKNYAGNAGATIIVRIYTGSSSPTTLVATSLNNRTTSEFTSSYRGYQFLFTPFLMTSGDYYWVSVVQSAATNCVPNTDVVSISTSTASGTSSIYINNGWTDGSPTSITPLFIYGNVAEPTTAPTASPTPNPSTYQYWNGTHWVSYIPATIEPNIFENGVAAPYIQMLVPIIILACASLLGWKFGGAWGFFAGLNIGAILAYMILGNSVFPLWGIVALLVIDGLLLFGKVGIRS